MAKNIKSRREDYAQWYLDVIKAAQLADYSPVRGCMVIRPEGFAIWEAIQRDLDHRFKETGLIAKVRGEGLVFGIECAEFAGIAPGDLANHIVEACYLGRPDGDAIHLLGPLAGKVLRVSPPMTMTEQQAHDSLALMQELLSSLAFRLDEPVVAPV